MQGWEVERSKKKKMMEEHLRQKRRKGKVRGKQAEEKIILT